MKRDSISTEEAQRAVDNLTSGLEEGRDTALDALSRRMKKRATRMKQVEARLVENLGENNPQVLRLRSRIQNSTVLQARFNQQVKRSRKVRKPVDDEWLVYGSVLDADGNPLQGLVVKAYDKDVRKDDLLGRASTDADGDYQIYFHTRDFMEPGEGEIELFLVVETKKRRKLQTTEKSLLKPEDRVFYCEITLPG